MAKQTLRPEWLLVPYKDVPETRDWLSEAEHRHLAGLRVEKRRRDWLVGRWTAKTLLRTLADLELDTVAAREIEIRATDSGAPEAYRDDLPLPVSLSISHRDGAGLCVVALGTAVGCDLERVEQRSDAFLTSFFSGHEREFVTSGQIDRDLAITAIWSAKESLLKLWQLGLAGGARRLEVELEVGDLAGDWQQLSVAYGDPTAIYRGWWTSFQGWVLTMVIDPPALRPRAPSAMLVEPI